MGYIFLSLATLFAFPDFVCICFTSFARQQDDAIGSEGALGRLAEVAEISANMTGDVR
jgi:hypothetical protein